MTSTIARSQMSWLVRRCFPAAYCAVLLASGVGDALAQEQPQPAPAAAAKTDAAAATDTAAAKEAAKIPPEQLDSLVAPIALYPDPLLAQTLVAATYPLEIIQLQQWMAKNPKLKDKELADAVAKQPWDPSIQSMAAIPDVVKRLADDVQWTTDLGNAFLAQQADVMDAVQRMRKKAEEKGALKSNEQQKVETEKVEGKTVIVIESTNPEVIYVPSYSPTVVYGVSMYPYPPIYYPPYPPGGAFISFSFGVMMGAAIWGGSCCGCGWGGNDIDINVNNNFNRNTNINRAGTGAGAGGGNWQHNPQHRGGTPYGDKSTANKYGGSARGDAAGGRGPSAGTQPARPGGGAGAGAGARPSTGAVGGAGDRAGGGAGARPSTGATGGAANAGSRGGDTIGGRDIPKGGSGAGGFSGGAGGYNGGNARASASRGASSMGSRGGGMSRGGGGGSRRR